MSTFLVGRILVHSLYMSLIDELQLELAAGHGGDGVVRWRQEKYRPMAGPSGGNGGRGGNVCAEAISDLSYLDFYRHKKKFQADHGAPGGSDSLEGKNGEDLVLKFPRGTIITRKSDGMQWSLEELGTPVILLEGGRGGLGNEHFKSSRNTTPYESTPGQPGAEDSFDIELQLFADIGLVGLPSAGKSTLLNATTNAKSKVAAYHFTTLDPHLGVLPSGKIMADLPGIIEGASEGKGLGFKFLRHIKRTKVVAHLVSCENEDVVAAYTGIRNELEQYGRGLADKEEIIILSKIDECSEEEWKAKQKELEKKTGKKVLTLSAFNDDLVKDVQKQLSDFCE